MGGAGGARGPPGTPDKPLRIDSICVSTSVASAATSPPSAIWTKKSSRTRDASTSAQFGDAGVSFALPAASVKATASGVSPSVDARDFFAGMSPFSP